MERSSCSYTSFSLKGQNSCIEQDSNIAKQTGIVSHKSQGVTSDVDIEKGKEITSWRATTRSSSTEGRESGLWMQIFQVKNPLFQKYLKSETKMCLDVMARYIQQFTSICISSLIYLLYIKTVFPKLLLWLQIKETIATTLCYVQP